MNKEKKTVFHPKTVQTTKKGDLNSQHSCTVLRSLNYLFLAPTLSIISPPAPAPATAIYCHLKLFYNSSTTYVYTM